MKQFSLTLLLLVGIVGFSSAWAQPRVLPVEPGCEGRLPSLSTVEKTEVSYLPILQLENIYTDVLIYAGQPRFWHTIECRFPYPSEIEAQSYRMEALIDGQWEEQVDMLENDNFSVRIPSSEPTSYRLVVVGGPNDGKYSNVITAEDQKVNTSIADWSRFSDSQSSYVGYKWRAPRANRLKVDNEEVEDYGSYIRYKWYRRNPYTYEETLIEGATGEYYTLSTEDVGYDVIAETCGDGVHLDFMIRDYMPKVTMAIICSTEYVGKDGIVLNTNYILPDLSELQFGNYQWSEETFEQYWKEQSFESVTTRKPGQYVFRGQLNDDYLQIVYGSEHTPLYMRVASPFSPDPDDVRMRQANVQTYPANLNLQVKYNNVLTSADVDIIRRNIDNEYVVEQTVKITPTDTTVVVMNGESYLRAHGTSTTLPSYYLGAACWEDASPVVSPTMNMDWNDSTFVLTLIDKPAPLTGKGVIEGTLTQKQALSAPLRASSRVSGLSADISVLLYNDKQTVVATTQVSSEGAYRFENVPFGSYSVVVDALGYSTQSAPSVTLTEENPVVSNVNYVMTDDGKVVSENATPVKGDANGDGLVTLDDVRFVVDAILGNSSALNSDMNGDGRVSVSDITIVIDALSKNK